MGTRDDDVMTPATEGKKRMEDKLNLAGFTILLVTIATQGFPDIAPEGRVSRLFEFSSQSGGGTFK